MLLRLQRKYGKCRASLELFVMAAFDSDDGHEAVFQCVNRLEVSSNMPQIL